jgi:hypothetical protein
MKRSDGKESLFMAKRSLTARAILAISLVLPACSTHRAVRHDFDNSRTFAAGFDQTWTAVTETAADLVLPIEQISRDSGLVTLQWIKIPRDWVDCFGQPPGPGTSQAAYLFNVFVRRESDTRTKVTVNSFIARPDVPVDYSQCFSTGAFEGLFFATIEEKLR